MRRIEPIFPLEKWDNPVSFESSWECTKLDATVEDVGEGECNGRGESSEDEDRDLAGGDGCRFKELNDTLNSRREDLGEREAGRASREEVRQHVVRDSRRIGRDARREKSIETICDTSGSVDDVTIDPELGDMV